MKQFKHKAIFTIKVIHTTLKELAQAVHSIK